MINWIDILLVIIIALYAFGGWRRGFILGIVDLLAWVGSVILSFVAYPYVAVALAKIAPSLGSWLTLVAFVSTFIIIRLLFSYIESLFMREVPIGIQTSSVNRFLGLVPGVINGLIMATVVAVLLMVTPISNDVSIKTRESRVVAELAVPAGWLEYKVSPVVKPVVNKVVAGLTIEPKDNEIIRLPFKTTTTTVRPDLEAEMLQLLNEERRKEALRPLQQDTALTQVARAHSKDMFDRQYFSHYTPEGADPFNRMKEANIDFTGAGENLALAPTLQIAHTGLMNSPGHRANILSRDFTSVGIGIIDGGMHGLMISQEFKKW